MTDEEFKIFSEKVDRGEQINREIKTITDEIGRIITSTSFFFDGSTQETRQVVNISDIRGGWLMKQERIPYSTFITWVVSELESQIKTLREEFESL